MSAPRGHAALPPGSPSREGPALDFHAATAERWQDVEEVLGRRGGHDGCWCMRWRIPREAFQRQRGEGNRRALQAGLASGRVTGVLGYLDGRPVSWCALGPREEFPGLEASDLLARVDQTPVWSFGCCYLARCCRARGMARAVVSGAACFARDRGARVLEAYPLTPALGRVPQAAAWTGFESMFVSAGFTEVARRAPLRPILRLTLDSGSAGIGDKDRRSYERQQVLKRGGSPRAAAAHPAPDAEPRRRRDRE